MMNRIKFLAAVCCVLAVFTACENDTKSKIEELENRIEELENGGNSNTGNDTNQNGGNSNTGSDNATGTANGHGYVDLGLSVKWATCNVGATKPEEYGNYYAWGETEPKTTYNWNTYKWATATQNEWGEWHLETLTKYNTDANYGTVDNKTVLDPEDDAAAVNWGGQWRMPTKEECEELLDNCTLKWVYSYKGTGVAGLIVTGPNGNSIFLPAAGSRNEDDDLDDGFYDHFWSSSLGTDYPDDAWYVEFLSIGVSMRGGNRYGGRYCGQSVRPVLGE